MHHSDDVSPPVPKPRGGKRPGAGRRATGSDRPSNIQLQPRHLKMLDAHRGADSRSAVVQQMIEREYGGIAPGEDGQPEGAEVR